MTVTERAALRQLYNFCCGYCGVSETDTVGHPLGVDESGPAHMRLCWLMRSSIG